MVKAAIFCKVLAVLLGVVGLTLIVASCDSPSDPPPPTPTPEPTVTQGSTSVTLLNTTVSLNANAFCSDGADFCADNMAFVPVEVGKVVTIDVTAPANLDPDVTVLNSAGGYVASGYSFSPGLEIVTFTPTQLDVYRVRLREYNRVGGSVTVVVTQ